MACNPQDYDVQTGVCAAPSWVVFDGGFLPSLAVSDALILGSAVVSVWALGFGFKILRKFLKG